jgi:hypothetical protein
VMYEPTIDAQNQPDWIMYLTPGPKAHAEFAAAHGGRKLRKAIVQDAIEAGDHQLKYRRTGPRRERSQSEPVSPPTFDPQLVAELTRRGIAEKKASQLLANLKPDQDVVAQLELGEHMVQHSRVPIVNPPGFYIRLIESNTSIPDGFETSAKRKARIAREAAERHREDERRAQEELETEYEWYCNQEIDRYIAALDPTEVAAVREAAREDLQKEHTTPWIIDSFTKHKTRSELAKRVTLLTLEEFVNQKRQGIDFSLKPVGLPPDAETVSGSALPPDVAVRDGADSIAPDPPAAPAERGQANPPAPNPATQPAISELAIEPLAGLPQQEPDGNAEEQGRV